MDDKQTTPAPVKAAPTERKRARVRDPFRQPLMVLRFVEDTREMLELAKKASVDAGRTERDRAKFLSVEAELAAFEKVANARLERDA